MPQRLILEDGDTTYNVLVESIAPPASDDLEAYNLNAPRSFNPPTIPPEMRVKLAEVHQTIQGYTQYAIGAFKNIASADVEEITLKFNLKISAEGGIPMLASGKTESDFAIEVKCKFPKKEAQQH
jgi:hypothetical protein